MKTSARRRLSVQGLAISVIVVIAVGLRLVYIDQPMRYDEAATYNNTVANGLLYSLTHYATPNNHIFHSVLVRISVAVFGNSPQAIRLPAFLAGVLLVPATFVAGWTLYGRNAALFGAALAASLGELVVFSTNARGYTLVSLAFVLLISIASRVRRVHDPIAWVVFVLVAAFGLFTVPTMLYPLGGVALWIIASAGIGDTGPASGRLGRDLALVSAATGLLGALLYTPVLLTAGLRSLVANPYVTPDSLDSFLLALRLLPSWLWHDWMLGVPWWARIVVATAVALGIVFHRRVSADRVPVWLAVIVWSAAVLFVTRRVPGVRIWLFLVPLVALVAGAGLALATEVLSRRVGWSPGNISAAMSVALALALAIHVVRTDAVYDPTLGDVSTLRDGPNIVSYLRTELMPGDRILTDIPSDAPLEFYLRRSGISRSFLAWDSMRSTVTPQIVGSRRLIVVVNPQAAQTRDGVLKINGVAREDVEEAIPPRRFPHGAVLHVLRWRSPRARMVCDPLSLFRHDV